MWSPVSVTVPVVDAEPSPQLIEHVCVWLASTSANVDVMVTRSFSFAVWAGPLITVGLSLTSVTVTLTVAVLVLGSARPLVVPLSVIV